MSHLRQQPTLFSLIGLLLTMSIVGPFSGTASAACSVTGLSESQRQQYSDANVLLYDESQNGCLNTCSPTTVAQPGAVTGSVSSFVDAYGQYAFDVGKKAGIPYDAILGQAALESGWGKSGLTTQAFNFFGIKVFPPWTGASITVRTAEYKPDGSIYYINAAFRKYANAGESFSDYAAYIHGSSRYVEALKYPNDPFAYLREVRAGGYATDGNYVSLASSTTRLVQKYISEKNLFPPSSAVTPDAGSLTYAATPATPVNCAQVGAAPGSSATGAIASVIQAAQAELAKKPVEYDANVLLYTAGVREAWCADFVSWAFKQGGMPFTGGDNGGWRIAAVLSMQSWFKSGKSGSTYFAAGQGTPRAGDVAFYVGAQTPDGGSTRHVNLVISVDPASNTMVTIGGNESNSLRMQTRQIKLGASSLVGFGRRTQ